MKMKREGQLEAESQSAAWRCDAVRPGCGCAASQKGRPAEREVKEERGVEDRKEDTAKEIEDLYTRAKRREPALPDRAGLNRKRQRTGT